MFYKLTLTTSGGFEQSIIEQIITYFKECDHAYLVNEFGEHGINSHLEGVVEFDTKKTSNVTFRIKRLYTLIGLDVTPYSIRVKKVTHLSGAIVYASKELKIDGKLMLLKGWKQTFIDLQAKELAKEKTYDVLRKQGTRITQKIAGAQVYGFATAHNMIVKTKQDCITVCTMMAQEGYLFGSIRPKGVFVDVCALFADGGATRMFFENELNWL